MSLAFDLFNFCTTPFGLFLLVALTLIYKYFKYQNDPLKNVPGPWGLPVVGYFPFLGRKMHLTLTDLWYKYGDVYQITIGSRQMVVVNGQKALRQALLNRHDFGGRPDYCSYQLASKDSLVGLNDYSHRYRVGKKLLLKAFGNFVVERKDGLQLAAHKAVGSFIEKIIKKANNQPFDPQPHMYPIVSTIMGYICWGEHFDIDAQEVKHILANADEFARTVLFGVVCDYFPWLKFLMNKQLQRLDKLFTVQKDHTKQLSLKHIESYDGTNLRDITDFFHKVSEDMTDEEKQNLHIDSEMLQYLGGGTFGAGFGTIAITTKWAMLLMGAYPEIQKKVQSELDREVGKDRYPQFDDSQRLPYTMAVINEVYRYSCIAAVPFAHKTTCDTEVCGLKIPADTVIICNLYSAHRDTSVFKNPDQFNPERFLNPDGSLNKASMETIFPYGLGTRRCGGEVVARLEIFTFISTLLQRCTIEAPPGCTLDPQNYKFSLALDPNPFEIIMRSRYGEW